MQYQKSIPAPTAKAIDALLEPYGTSLKKLITQTPDRKAGQLLKVNEVAKLLQISVPTAWRLIRKGQLKPIYIGEACTRISEKQVLELIEQPRKNK